MPVFEYSPEERRVWRAVLERLQEAHAKSAFSTYLRTKETLGITPDDIPQGQNISETLHELSGFHLAPAEGLLAPADFFGCLADRRFPCTQYLRHGSDPAFTPEPDMVHDLVGHVPLLADHDYAALIELLGSASCDATKDRLFALSQFYWFGIEFGLIQERGETKVFGAGLLSSYGEMQHALSSQVERRPFRLDDVIETQYDPTRMQDVLFVIPSLAFLRTQLETLVGRSQA